MKFHTLQENLRRTLWVRIDAGTLTGLHLAKQTGFKQAHISNFLNRKRGLSLEGMDRVLTGQHLSVLDLIDPVEVNKRASILPASDEAFDDVVVADPHVAACEPSIMNMHAHGILKFRKNFLRRLRQDSAGDRKGWERFVVIEADKLEGVSMYPRILPGATLLLDRHYRALTPYRKGERNIYAVGKNGTCMIGYVETVEGNLVLRPHNRAHPIEVIAMEDGQKPSHYIVGRVCHVGVDT
jgi:Peptidase S24-like